MDNAGSQLELDYKSTWDLFQGKAGKPAYEIERVKKEVSTKKTTLPISFKILHIV